MTLFDQAADVFCNRLARIDTLGPNRRLIFTIPDITEPNCEHVTVKLIVPAEMLMMMAAAMAGADAGAVSQQLLALETRLAN